MFSLENLKYLLSPSGTPLLHRLASEDLSEANVLRLLTILRRDYAPEQASAALEMARLRLKAVEKFGEDARRMLFTREALEQASDPLVRRYRAHVLTPPPSPLPVHGEGEQYRKHLHHDSAISIIDAGCGIGADSLAFAAAGMDVLGLDTDPVRIEIARYNAAALGLKARFEVADIRDGLPDADAVFFDPARRDGEGKRIYDVERYEPPLSTVRGWSHALIVVKLSPGVDLEQLKPYGGCIEFISVEGDLKEAVLWLDEDRSFRTFATLIRNAGRWIGHWYSSEGLAEIAFPQSQPHAWLVEPDPAILRAGLVREVAAQFDGFLLDETIAYFTTDEKPDSPWVRVWKILDWMPFNLKKLRAYLRERNVGQVTVKKRGSPITPEELTAQLKLKGDETRTLVLTRLRGQPIVIICALQPG